MHINIMQNKVNNTVNIKFKNNDILYRYNKFLKYMEDIGKLFNN